MIDPTAFRLWVEERATLHGKCWVWKLSLKDGTQPQGKYFGKIVNVRRVLIEHRTGKAVPKGEIGACSCLTKGCVRPEHLKAVSRSKAFKGRVFTLQHKVALAEAARARSGLTLEQVEELRIQPGTAIEKSRQTGIGVKYMRDILNRKVWRDYRSPFAALM